MDDGKVTITIEIDAELLARVTEVLKQMCIRDSDNTMPKCIDLLI